MVRFKGGGSGILSIVFASNVNPISSGINQNGPVLESILVHKHQ